MERRGQSGGSAHLAVAYAEQANYGPAAATARRALELAAGQKKDALAATLQNEMKLYVANTGPGKPRGEPAICFMKAQS